MPSMAQIVRPSTTQWGTDGASLTTVPEVKSLVVPEPTVDYRDVTSQDTPGKGKEYLPGEIDYGDLTLSCIYTPDTYGAAFGYMTAGTLVVFKVTLPIYAGQQSGDVIDFSAYVAPVVENASDTASEVMLTLNLKVSGDMVYTKGAAAT